MNENGGKKELNGRHQVAGTPPWDGLRQPQADEEQLMQRDYLVVVLRND